MKILILGLLGMCCWMNAVGASEEDAARAYMKQLNEKAARTANKVAKAAWNYATNITKENLEIQLRAYAEAAKQTEEAWSETIKFKWKSFRDDDLRRQFSRFAILGASALSPEKLTKLSKLVSDMSAIYSTAKICSYKDNTKCDLALDPDIITLMKTSRDAEELKYVWVEWRKKTAAAKPLFIEYVKLVNEAAKLNTFSNNADMWLYGYEDSSFKSKIEDLWGQIKPLYLKLHAYVRFKLREKYGDVVSETGPIPAHLLGDMWAQTWTELDFLLPYPQAVDIDKTKALVEKGYTPKKMFESAEDFFVSLNLSKMTPEFWKNSLIEKPKDGRELVCHASAWDFSDGRDFRIKQCTKIDFADFITIHHEMGHIQYYMQYKDQPTVYRNGANDGFHEAVGDTIALSVSTLKHLKKIGLIDEEVPDNEETELNNLFKIALSKIAFLPFGYLIDLWRWDIFEGQTSSEFYNCKWWYYRKNIQGVEPPVERSEADFDGAAMYHVVADISYLRYFIAFIIQFQFHQAACKKAGEYDANDPAKPLYNCDIYQNKEAGKALGDMLEMGSSRPWPEAMEKLTGQRNMDASSILEYFKPIEKWLDAENEKNKVFIGWPTFPDTCKTRLLRGSARRQFTMKYFSLCILGLLWYMI